MEEVVNSTKKSPSRCRRRLQGLSHFLGRNKRIGCLPMPNNDSVEKISSSQEGDLEIKGVLPKKERDRDRSSSKEAAPDQNNQTSTNVSLCCAITENSRTPVHVQTRSRAERNHDVNNIVMNTDCHNNGSDEINTSPATGFSLNSSFNNKLPPNGLIAPKENPKLVVEPSMTQSHVQQMAKAKKSHRRSFSLSKSIFSSAEKTGEKNNSLSSTPGPSPEGSPLLAAHSNNINKLLLSRQSVDNIVISSSTSSPLSTRSNPPNDDVKKKKTRPASLIVLSRKDKGEPSRTASMDSLARQSLLAAQVLHLIPSNKARERNFLCGRIAANSLLGNVELERVLPQREVRIYVATWNMNGQAPPQGLNSLLLPEGVPHVPDIVVVGTQESYPEKGQWEVTLQETLGPSHVLFHSSSFGTLHIAIFLRRDLIWFCSVADEATYSVRPGTAFRTKGAIAVAFYLFGTTFLFLTCHLTAHQDKVKERLQDIRRIVKALELPNRLTCRHKNKDVTDNFDYVFWSGDLNFRLTRPREEVIDWVSQKTFPLSEPAQCTPGDQLTDSIVDGSILKGFEEGPLTFAPTYKYDPGSMNFDTSNKQRVPSYTDRILYKTKRIGSENAVECLAYSSVPSVCTSDHKPVWGLYRCPIRPGIDTIPLNAGLFNREIYLEAIKRRASALDQQDSTSAVCSIQ